MSQSQRHSPGTIPALEGVSPPPLLQKDNVTELNLQYFPQEQPRGGEAGSFQLWVTNNINKVFAQYPGFFTGKFP